MPTNPLVKKLELSADELDRQMRAALSAVVTDDIESVYTESIKNFEAESILREKIVNIVGNDVIVDVGYKSEGVIPLEQFEDATKVKEGDEVEVLLEAVEDETGMVQLSKRKADRIRGWERVISTYKEGDI